MKRALCLVTLALACAAPRLAFAEPPAPPPAADDFDGIDRTRDEAYAKGQFAFCKEPSKPLGIRQKALCPLAESVPGCEGFAAACKLEEPPKLDWLERFAAIAAPVARVLLYVFVAVVVIALVVPVVLALRRRRRTPSSTAPKQAAATVTVLENENEDVPALALADAELALRSAEEHLQRGEVKKALALFLAAALSALDRRGAIRLARHRTNGEYVRSCSDGSMRQALREIVREVERVTFGGEVPNEAGARRISSIATEIVRSAATTLVLVALVLGQTSCRLPGKGADPAGAELPTTVLASNGYDVRPLETSLATVPIPADGPPSAVVIVDIEKVQLEDEARSHLMRWVEAGGTLVLLGMARPGAWKESPRVEYETAETTELTVRAARPIAPRDMDDEDDADDDASEPPALLLNGARVARPDAYSCDDADTVATLGNKVYASTRVVGGGQILGIANDDLFTNVGVMPPRNAAALVTILRSATHSPLRRLTFPAEKLSAIRIARPEDGISPPTNPFSALLAAGLAKGVWHALAAAVVLFFAYGIRLTRARSAERHERRKTAEHVVAMGAFYEHARAHVHALAMYGRFVEMRLRELAPAGTEAAVFLATRSGVTTERAREVYGRALSAQTGDAPVGDELGLLEELRSMFARAIGSNSS